MKFRFIVVAWRIGKVSNKKVSGFSFVSTVCWEVSRNRTEGWSRMQELIKCWQGSACIYNEPEQLGVLRCCYIYTCLRPPGAWFNGHEHTSWGFMNIGGRYWKIVWDLSLSGDLWDGFWLNVNSEGNCFSLEREHEIPGGEGLICWLVRLNIFVRVCWRGPGLAATGVLFY